MAGDIDTIKRAITQQNKVIASLTQRITALEQKIGVDAPPAQSTVTETVAPAKTAATPTENPTNLFKIFGIVGAILILLGVVYFYKYAVDQGWIGIQGRIALGVLAALAFIGSGLLLYRKDYTNFSQVVFAIGFGILYFTVFATYHFSEYRNALGMTLLINTLLLMAVMAGGLVLGMRLELRFISYGSLALGYLAAFLAGIDGDTLHILIYVLLLDLVVLAIAYRKAWYIGIPAQAITYIAYLIWYIQGISSPESILSQTSSPVLLTFGFLLLYYALFTILSFIQESGNPQGESIALSIINTVALVAFGLGIVYKYAPEFNGLYLMATAAVTVFVGWLARNKGLGNVFDVHFLLTCILVAIAIPVQFDYTIVTVLWVVMLLGLMYAGAHIDHTRLFFTGYIGYALIVLRLLFHDLWISDPIQRWLSVGVGLAGLIAMQYIAEQFRKQKGYMHIYTVAGIVLGMIWIPIEIMRSDAGGQMGLVLISVLWALYAIVLIAIGISQHRKIFNWCGIIIFGIVVLKVLIIDLGDLQNILRVLALIIVGALALVGSFLFVRNREVIKGFF